MPPRPEDKGKSKGRRRRYNTHVVDPATIATLAPLPAPTAASSQGSTGSSQASVAAPAGASPPFGFPPGFHYGSSPPFPFPSGFPFGSSPPYPYGFPEYMIPPQQPPPQPQQQPPPQPQQQIHVPNGDGEVDDEMPDYEMDDRDRFVIVPSGNSFMPCKPAASAIKDIIQGKYQKPWKTYGEVDEDEKEAWFNLFQTKCTWNPRYYDMIRRNFHIRAAARLSDMLRNARVRYERKRTRPHWIGEPLMAQLVDYWASTEFKEKSEKAKKNRASEKGGCIHTGGCISNAEHARRLAKKLGREPYINELHKQTHTYNSGQFVDDRSRICQEEYDRQLAEALSRGCSVDEALSLRTWTKVAGDKSKGRLYGAGNLAGNYRKGIAATLKFSLNAGEGSSRQPELTPEMREMIQKLTQEQLAVQMASQEQLVQQLLQKQQDYFQEQLSQFRQAQGWPTGEQQGTGTSQRNAQNLRAPLIDDNDDPYEVFGEEEDVETEEED